MGQREGVTDASGGGAGRGGGIPERDSVRGEARPPSDMSESGEACSGKMEYGRITTKSSVSSVSSDI